MKLNQIEILGVIILEPIGSLTDFITGLISLVVAYLLWKNKSPHKSIHLFTCYFLFTGLATVCGGTIGHALLYYISPEWKMVGWSLSAIGLFFFELASFAYFRKRLSFKVFKSLKSIIIVQLVVFFILLIIPSTRSFKLVQLNATFSYLGIILPLYFYSIFSWKNNRAWLVIGAIVHASITAIVYNMEITIDRWFNHHALTHVLMTLYVIFMYYAVISLHTPYKNSKFNTIIE
jgi:uncharacterized protein DUF6962